jgi:hypothetical protein
MKWEKLLSEVGQEPVFGTGFLAASCKSMPDVRLQLSRWVKAGKLIQLRKGLYTLAQPHRKVAPHPFVIANAMKKASYVSLQSALAFHGMVPEHVPIVTSTTTQRPEQVNTPLGRFFVRHIKKDWFYGYKQTDLGQGQRAFVAVPEKALLDLVYLTPDSADRDFLMELRLQNLEQLDSQVVLDMANAGGSKKLSLAGRLIAELVEQQARDEL